jgi:hypothetical protein
MTLNLDLYTSRAHTPSQMSQIGTVGTGGRHEVLIEIWSFCAREKRVGSRVRVNTPLAPVPAVTK